MTTNKIANVAVCGHVIVLHDTTGRDLAIITYTMLVNAGHSGLVACQEWCNRNGYTLEQTVLR